MAAGSKHPMQPRVVPWQSAAILAHAFQLLVLSQLLWSHVIGVGPVTSRAAWNGDGFVGTDGGGWARMIIPTNGSHKSANQNRQWSRALGAVMLNLS